MVGDSSPTLAALDSSPGLLLAEILAPVELDMREDTGERCCVSLTLDLVSENGFCLVSCMMGIGSWTHSVCRSLAPPTDTDDVELPGEGSAGENMSPSEEVEEVRHLCFSDLSPSSTLWGKEIDTI